MDDELCGFLEINLYEGHIDKTELLSHLIRFPGKTERSVDLLEKSGFLLGSYSDCAYSVRSTFGVFDLVKCFRGRKCLLACCWLSRAGRFQALHTYVVQKRKIQRMQDMSRIDLCYAALWDLCFESLERLTSAQGTYRKRRFDTFCSWNSC